MTLIWIKNKHMSKISHNSLINEKSYTKLNNRIKWEFGLLRPMISTWKHLVASHRQISMSRDSAFSPFKFPLLSISTSSRSIWSTVFWELSYSAFYPSHARNMNRFITKEILDSLTCEKQTLWHCSHSFTFFPYLCDSTTLLQGFSKCSGHF